MKDAEGGGTRVRVRVCVSGEEHNTNVMGCRPGYGTGSIFVVR